MQGYGLMLWRDLFTPRQLTALGTFVAVTRAARQALADADYPPKWMDLISVPGHAGGR